MARRGAESGRGAAFFKAALLSALLTLVLSACAAAISGQSYFGSDLTEKILGMAQSRDRAFLDLPAGGAPVWGPYTIALCIAGGVLLLFMLRQLIKACLALFKGIAAAFLRRRFQEPNLPTLDDDPAALLDPAKERGDRA